MYQKMSKKLKSSVLFLLIVLSAFSIILFIPRTQAASIPMHIIWDKVTITFSYDNNDKGEFKIQVKYNNGQDWKAQKSATHKCSIGTFYPQITFTLNDEVLVGSYVYLRMIEADFWSKDDQEIIKFLSFHNF